MLDGRSLQLLPADCTPLTAGHAHAADGNLDNHAIAHHVDPNQCALALTGQWLVYLKHVYGQDVLSKLRAAVEHGDTAYCDIPCLTSAATWSESLTASSRLTPASWPTRTRTCGATTATKCCRPTCRCTVGWSSS